MKIAHITYHYYPIIGGQEIYIENLISVLWKYNIQSTVYQPINKYYHFFTKNKLNHIKLVFSIPLIGRIIPGIGQYLFNFFLLFHLYFILRNYDKIIIHYAFHTIPFWFFKKKIIVLSHGVDWDTEDFILTNKLKKIIAKKAIFKFVTVANDTHYFRSLGINIAPKEKYFQEVKKNLHFIPNCVDSNKFAPSSKEMISYTDKVILVPRQICYDRGIHLAIEAFSIFTKRYPDFKLKIVGPIRDFKYKKFCDGLINKYSINDRVYWIHNITNDKIVEYYRRAMVVLIPSIRREGTSLSALESMASGCPVISTNVGGLADLPTIQCNPDPQSIANCLIYLFDDYSRIKSQQIELTRRIFNIENWSDAWFRILKTNLNKY